MNWNTVILKTLADANRKLGEVKKDQSYINYANALDSQMVILEAEEIKKES